MTSGRSCGTASIPRMRSFIINWLNPLGADPGAVAASSSGLRPFSAGLRVPPPRPAERGEGGRRPGEGSSAPTPATATTEHGPPGPSQPQVMDTILFHPETSIRRALILALGTYGPDALSSAEREP